MKTKELPESGASVPGGVARTQGGGIVRAHNIVQRLAAIRAKNLYVHGGKTVKEFLRAGLVDRPAVTRLPVLIGGIPLFGALDKDITLKHIDTSKYSGGSVQSEYEVLR